MPAAASHFSSTRTVLAVSAIVFSLVGMRIYTFFGIKYALPLTSLRESSTSSTTQCSTITVADDLVRLSTEQRRSNGQEDAQFRAMEDAVFINCDWAIVSNFEQEHFVRRGHFPPQSVPLYYPLLGLHLPSQQLFELPLLGFPAGVAFRPHGIDIQRTSESTGVLLVVNHALLDGGERIEHLTYSLSENAGCAGETISPESAAAENSCQAPLLPQLQYVQSAVHPLLGEGAMNDVALLSLQPLSFFATRWKARDIDFSSWDAPIEKIIDVAVLLLNLPTTYIVYCSAINEEDRFECAVPQGQYFTGMYNGIALSSDKRRLLAADMSGKTIAAYRILPPSETVATTTIASATLPLTPRLKKLRTVFTPHLVDNIALDEQQSTADVDVLTTAGIYAFKFIPPALGAFEKSGYDAFRAPLHPNDLRAPHQLPSAMQSVRINYTSSDSTSSDSNASSIEVTGSKVRVQHVSRDGAWSFAAVSPFHGSSNIDSNNNNERLFLLGSFLERYVLMCRQKSD